MEIKYDNYSAGIFAIQGQTSRTGLMAG